MEVLIITKNNLKELITKKFIEYNYNKKSLKILIKINILTIDLPNLLILYCCYNKLNYINYNNYNNNILFIDNNFYYTYYILCNNIYLNNHLISKEKYNKINNIIDDLFN